MAITFPSNPITNQTFTSNTKTWKWNGVAWDAVLTNTGGGGGSGLDFVGVSGGTSVSEPTSITIESISDVFKIYAQEVPSGNALLSFGITGESGTTLSHDLPNNHFYGIASADRNGYGHKFLKLNEDGTVGFQYIFLQDIFRPTEFTFSIGSFTINGSASGRTALIGPNTDVFALTDISAGTDQFAVSYPSVTIDPIAARISGFSDDVDRNLSDPFTTLSTSGLGVTYPSGSDGTVTFTLYATGDDGSTDTATCSVTFPNYLFYGVTGSFGVNGSNLADNGFNEVLKTGSDLSSGVSITLNWSDPTQKAWFAYPSKHGQITSIVETDSNQDQTGTWDLISIESFANSNNYVEEFYIYRSSESGSGIQNLTFKT